MPRCWFHPNINISHYQEFMGWKFLCKTTKGLCCVARQWDLHPLGPLKLDPLMLKELTFFLLSTSCRIGQHVCPQPLALHHWSLAFGNVPLVMSAHSLLSLVLPIISDTDVPLFLNAMMSNCRISCLLISPCLLFSSNLSVVRPSPVFPFSCRAQKMLIALFLFEEQVFFVSINVFQDILIIFVICLLCSHEYYATRANTGNGQQEAKAIM